MMHRTRIHCVSGVATMEELARMLTLQTWTLCTAFVVIGHEDYLFLNDATHEDGAGEYAVVKKLPDGSLVQVESITFSWCTPEKALGYIRGSLAGEYDQADYTAPIQPRLETPAEHGRCQFCA
jgi:hypothetical protein